MKRILIILAAILLTAALSALVVSAESSQAPNQMYTITEPYDYPILPGDEGWDDLSPAERNAAVQVDPSILDSMTTEALMETAFRSPLAALMFAHDTLEQGVESARKSCPAIDVILSRPDVREKLLAYRADETISEMKRGYAKRLLIFLNQTETAVMSVVSTKPDTPI